MIRFDYRRYDTLVVRLKDPTVTPQHQLSDVQKR
jgi:hypothetical protein